MVPYELLYYYYGYQTVRTSTQCSVLFVPKLLTTSPPVHSLSLSPSGCGSLRWGVSHTGSPSPVLQSTYKSNTGHNIRETDKRLHYEYDEFLGSSLVTILSWPLAALCPTCQSLIDSFQHSTIMGSSTITSTVVNRQTLCWQQPLQPFIKLTLLKFTWWQLPAPVLQHQAIT